MTKPRAIPTVKGRDGKHSYKPTIAVGRPERQHLENQLDESKRWLIAGLRQADGQEIHTRHLRSDLPTERELISKAYDLAIGVDDLIDQCKQKAPRA